MKTIIKIEKVSNGFIIQNNDISIKKIAENAATTAKIISSELSSVFEEMKDGDIKELEFEIK